MEIITTADGSHTLFSEHFNDIYHSRHGAILESQHVYINQGLHAQVQSGVDPVSILEIGFGTGLNALLTMLYARESKIKIRYHALEPYPVSIDIIKRLNFTELLGFEYCYGPYHTLHLCRWEEWHDVTNFFCFKKSTSPVYSLTTDEKYSLIFYDAFAPTHQPEMWTADIFKKINTQIIDGGELVTYCSKNWVRKNMEAAGFIIEKLQGPPGKREMIRAVKPKSTR